MKVVNNRGVLALGEPCVVKREGSPGLLVARPPGTEEPTHEVVSDTSYGYGIGGARFDGPWAMVMVASIEPATTVARP